MSRKETIEIKDVDIDLLDAQRLTLGEYTIEHVDVMEPEVLAALEGILNMLDAWSDDRRPDLPQRLSRWMPNDPKVGYPKDVVEVVGTDRDKETHELRVKFVYEGYCPVYSAGIDKFKDRFRPLTQTELDSKILPELAYFGFEDGPLILAFTYGDRWNGWGLPVVDKESFRKWLEVTGDMFGVSGDDYSYFKFEGDNLILHIPAHESDTGQPIDQVMEPAELIYRDKTYQVYAVGNGWCWDQYDAATFKFEPKALPTVCIPAGLEEVHEACTVRNKTENDE